MNTILPIAIWAALGLIGATMLVMGLAGLRNMWYGKVKPRTIALIALPAALLLVFGFTMGTWVQAGIYTLVTMLALLFLGMLLTGLRSAYQGAFS